MGRQVLEGREGRARSIVLLVRVIRLRESAISSPAGLLLSCFESTNEWIFGLEEGMG